LAQTNSDGGCRSVQGFVSISPNGWTLLPEAVQRFTGPNEDLLTDDLAKGTDKVTYISISAFPDT
jgi:hypothetical protein